MKALQPLRYPAEGLDNFLRHEDRGLRSLTVTFAHCSRLYSKATIVFRPNYGSAHDGFEVTIIRASIEFNAMSFALETARATGPNE